MKIESLVVVTALSIATLPCFADEASLEEKNAALLEGRPVSIHEAKPAKLRARTPTERAEDVEHGRSHPYVQSEKDRAYAERSKSINPARMSDDYERRARNTRR